MTAANLLMSLTVKKNYKSFGEVLIMVFWFFFDSQTLTYIRSGSTTHLQQHHYHKIVHNCSV